MTPSMVEHTEARSTRGNFLMTQDELLKKKTLFFEIFFFGF
jgi:hypothetical protein